MRTSMLLAALLAVAGCQRATPTSTPHALPPKPQDGAKDSSGTFDAQNLGHTWGWMTARAQEVEEAHSNEVASGRLRDAIRTEMSGWTGRKVSWEVKVERVNSRNNDRAELILEELTSPVSGDAHMDAMQAAAAMDAYPRSMILFYRLRVQGAEIAVAGTPPVRQVSGAGPFHVPADDFAASLKRGTKLRLEGAIAQATFEPSGTLPVYEYKVLVDGYSFRPTP